ncbi:GTPase Der [Streptomyces violaceorubidus]
MAWAPRVNVSAQTGRHMEKLVPAIETALAGWETRVPTGRLNAFLGELVAAHPHPVRGGKQPRILFGTQAGTRAPRFVLFASGFIEAGYRRFIERRLQAGARLMQGQRGEPVSRGRTPHGQRNRTMRAQARTRRSLSKP